MGLYESQSREKTSSILSSSSKKSKGHSSSKSRRDTVVQRSSAAQTRQGKRDGSDEGHFPTDLTMRIDEDVMGYFEWIWFHSSGGSLNLCHPSHLTQPRTELLRHTC